MHMQEGVGRHGYRMLALTFGSVGLLGIVSSLYAYQPGAGMFEWLGLALQFSGLVLLMILVTVVLGSQSAQAPPEPAASRPTGVRMAMPVNPPGSPPASRDLGVEYGDAQPAAGAAPESLVLPNAFQDSRTGPETVVPLHGSREPQAWPQRRKGGVTRGEMADRYTEHAPLVRQILTNDGKTTVEPANARPPPEPRLPKPPEPAPTVVAKIAPRNLDPDWVEDGMGRGKCGGCDTPLLAPTARPMNLRCPRCDKITLLE